MCDYSLNGLPSRLAQDGEDLVVHRFSTHSMGLISPVELQCAMVEKQVQYAGLSRWERIKSFLTEKSDEPGAPAVCIPPSARLLMTRIPEDLQCKWNIGEEELVTFVQISAEVNSYRDAIHFRNGLIVLLQSLREGIPVKVISVGCSEEDGVRVQPEREPETV